MLSASLVLEARAWKPLAAHMTWALDNPTCTTRTRGETNPLKEPVLQKLRVRKERVSDFSNVCSLQDERKTGFLYFRPPAVWAIYLQV